MNRTVFTDNQIVNTVCAECGWSHFIELDKSGIYVAEYLTTLPPKELLQKKLHAAIRKSRQQLENRVEERV